MILQNIKQECVLAVCYGGGHVLMLIPVLKHLKSLGYKVHVLGLTTAATTLKNAGFDPIGFKDLIQPEDSGALEHGIRLAKEMHKGDKVQSLDESIAYLGLSYADLEDQLGVEEAKQEFTQKGRQAFLPLAPVRRLFDKIQPDVLLTTNSPRAELASIRVAAERAIPSVGVLDLFGFGSHNDIPADYVCVPFNQAASNLVDRGLNPNDIVVTGNPNFDWVSKLSKTKSQAASWRIQHRVKPNEMLGLYAMKPNWDEHEEMIVQSLEQVLPQNPSFKITVRAHPSSDNHFAERVLKRLGDRAFLNQNTPLPLAVEACDALITHKSTVAVEAALLGKQVALFNSNRNYSTHAIPLNLYNWSTLSISVDEGIEALSELKKDTAEMENQRGAAIRKAWNCDGQSHIRIADIVVQALNSSKQSKSA